MLLTCGTCPTYPPILRSTEYFKISSVEYSLKLFIWGIGGMPIIWRYAFIVPKIDNETVVILNVKYF